MTLRFVTMDQEQEHDQAPTTPGLGTPEDKKSGDKDAGVGKLVKLRAFNIFASKIRDSIKDENPVANGHEIKRIVGKKWAKLGNGDKQEFIDIAQNENDLIEKLPVDPNAPKRRRRRRTKTEMDDSPGARTRRARPRRSGDDTNGEASNGEGQPKRRRVRKQGKALDPAYVGKHFRGTADGSFDAGYLLTVRVGDIDLVFRGVLFEPSMGVPPNNSNDVAPSVKLARRNDGIVFPSKGSASSSKQIHGGPGLASGTVSLLK